MTFLIYDAKATGRNVARRQSELLSINREILGKVRVSAGFHEGDETARPLLDILLEIPAVADPLGPDKLRTLTDPANYLGAAPAMVDHMLARRAECDGAE